MRLLRNVFLVGAVAVSSAACARAKLGDPCRKEGAVTCQGENAALVCVDARWESETCTAATGCSTWMGLGDGNCASDGHEVGEPCPGQEGNPACSADKKAMLTCARKRWVKSDDCKGQRGCASSASGTTCDKGTEAEGAPCTSQNEGKGACSPDRLKLLLCKGGKMLAASICRGPRGCREAGEALDCDDSIALPGDVCDEEGEPACSANGGDLLKCKGSTFTVEKTCARCTPFPDKVDCD